MEQKIINEILLAMEDDLSTEQLQHLSTTLTVKLHKYRIVEVCTQIARAPDDQWQNVVRLWIATKRLENCSEGTIENYQRCMVMFLGATGKPLNDITTNDLRYYLAAYQERRHISASYLETMRHTMCSFFGWVQDEGFIDTNPTRKLKRIKVPKKLMQPYTGTEREILKSEAECQRDLALMEVLYSTAARIGEIVSLNRNDINFDSQDILIYGQKGKSERMVYLTDSAAYHLKKYLDSRDDDNPALFVSLRAPHKRMTISGIQAMMRKLGRKTGIHVHPHKFRRTLLTDAGARGVPLQELREYAGHVKADTTLIYVKTQESSVRASFRRYIS
ncbi:MAG: tyrosine-type recombinase/integrase [Oscillospiraceae bacterium]|nr:tyrosine-type recombinase/integrase [Oscillospiraceae bacterium]